MGHKPQ